MNGRKSGQDFKAEALEELGLLLPMGFLILLFFTPRNHQELYHTQWLGTPNQPLTKKILHELAHRTIGSGYFLSWGSLFPNDSSLCQLDVELDSTLSMPRHILVHHPNLLSMCSVILANNVSKWKDYLLFWNNDLILYIFSSNCLCRSIFSKQQEIN